MLVLSCQNLFPSLHFSIGWIYRMKAMPKDKHKGCSPLYDKHIVTNLHRFRFIILIKYLFWEFVFMNECEIYIYIYIYIPNILDRNLKIDFYFSNMTFWSISFQWHGKSMWQNNWVIVNWSFAPVKCQGSNDM